MTIGYIYKIVCLDPNVKDTYVGSCSVMAKRRCAHKSMCNNETHKSYNLNVYQFIRAHGGWSNWNMIAIEQVEYTIKHELLVRERFHLECLKASLNKVIPTRTRQEYREEHKEERKEYRQANQIEIAQYKKEYRETNQIEIAQYQKEYREEHKEERKEYQKEYQKEHKEERKEYQKEYQKENQIEIAERKKELITCDCHRTFRKADIAQHKKTKIHKQYVYYYNFIHS
jgi:hypothetical protein